MKQIPPPAPGLDFKPEKDIKIKIPSSPCAPQKKKKMLYIQIGGALDLYYTAQENCVPGKQQLKKNNFKKEN